MDAVASNLGVDASKLVPDKKPEPKKKRSRSRDKFSRSPKRESKSATPQPSKSSTPQPAPVKTENGTGGHTKKAEEPALKPPPTIPAQSFSSLQPGKGNVSCCIIFKCTNNNSSQVLLMPKTKPSR